MSKKLRNKAKQLLKQKSTVPNQDDWQNYLKMKASASYFSMFESSSSYILDDFNSIQLYQNRIYNLLKAKPSSLREKQLRCKCSKSKCLARYCECFTRGKICQLSCECQNCQNAIETNQLIRCALAEKSEVGCKCSKSECSQNYCQCYQKGECCSFKCKCTNCRNN